jgi:7-cyano-7-deazaguanine synthase
VTVPNGNPRAAIALLSGGLDSVVAAGLWLEGGGSIARCLTFDYGQRAYAREKDAAQRFAARHGLAVECVALPWLASVSRAAGSALVDVGSRLPEGTLAAPGDDASALAVWVPARNCVFLAIGAAYAEAAGAGAVLAGFNREEAATFPDNSEAFVGAASAFLRAGTKAGVRVEAPVQGLDKRGIVAAARRLGIRRSDLWSCYRGDAVPCGRCESCLRSERAWAET